MCGRYELHSHPAALALAFGLDYPPEIRPRYNIAPMQDVPVIRMNQAGGRELAQMRWGLVPRWAKDPSIGAKMINARAETLTEKRAFRNALQRHRCLLPADGFYEWKPGNGGIKQPMHVGMADGAPFALAGLYDRWLTPEGDALDTCTIITARANAQLAAMHDRMPVIIAPETYERWLDVASDDIGDLLLPFPANAMTWYPVSTRVNSVRNEGPELIERVAQENPTPPHEPEPDSPADVPKTKRKKNPRPEQARLF